MATILHSLINNPAFRKAGLLLLVFAGLLLVLIVALSRGKALDTRHEPFVFSESFDFDAGTYADYIAYAERRLRAAHTAESPQVIANLLPFRLEPAADCPRSQGFAFRNGVLLTHDLLESPYSLRSLALTLRSRCFLVYGLLLPGHATQPGDLLQVQWEEWAAAERFAARELAKEAENLYLGGHGMGGTLAVLGAANNAGVDGLMLFAPALADTSFTWQRLAAPVIGWLVPAARWAEVRPTWSSYIYDSVPWHARGEHDALVAAMHAALPTRPFEVPVFTVVSTEDSTVSTPATLAFMTERIHPLSVTVVYSRDPGPAQPGRRIFSSRMPNPEVEIVSLSHRGLINSYDDPEFGWAGSSHDCGHYFLVDTASYDSCMAGESTVLGETLPELLELGLLERVEFNIYFDDMVNELERFIEPVAQWPAEIDR